MNEKIAFLNHIAYQMRRWSIRMTSHAGSGHPTSALSSADIVAALFFDAMHFDPDNFDNPNNDRFILSKGHASPVLYAVWHELGKLSDTELMTYREFGSPLEGHPALRFKYAEAATGSLGMGLSIGAGEALAARQTDREYKTFVLMGDSEVSEGSIWEAVEIARYYQLNNLIGIIDCNRLGQTTETMEAQEGDAPERFKTMFEAFGWHAMVVNGHDMQALLTAFDAARTSKDKPVMIIAHTQKGYGVDLFEGKEGWHGKALKPEQEKIALDQLADRFKEADEYTQEYEWHPHAVLAGHEEKTMPVSLPDPSYQKGESIPTRKVYGQALAAVGDVCPQAVSLDGEVKNSTYAELFEEAHPDRFYQCFIAEQNMVGMGIGFDRRGLMPFISSFASFLSRAHDQIRMAAIGDSNIKLCGSHAGVSIGQDGPSQMGLEDIAMMRGLPESIVLYPCDAVSTYKLVGEMANYQDGIAYLRTTRMATPVIYEPHEQFKIGKCKVLRQSENDRAVVIGAGVTLHEALKAHEHLAKEDIAIAVIDLYSVKPLDIETISALAYESNNQVITVEDHYRAGGIGEAIAAALSSYAIEVHQLAVDHLPRSGKPEQLLADQRIDAAAIIEQVKKIVS